MTFDDVKGADVTVCIQYIDCDGATVLNERQVVGVVHNAHAEHGVVIAVDGDRETLMNVPPSLDAWTKKSEGSFSVHWLVFRTQEKRADGEHEWWEWKPKRV